MSSISSSFPYIIQQITYYFGIPLLFAGLLGGIFNIIVFLSLQTFRQSSCAFYLIVISIVNLGQLLTGLLSRIMINGFSIDWTQTSLFYCKFRYFVFQTCALISCTCLCLAILDQYFATCSKIQLQQFSRLKVAYCLTITSTLIWLSIGIFYLIYFYHAKSSSTDGVTCLIWNRTFSLYNSYGFVIILSGALPVIISVLLGILVYRNIQQLTYRTVPLVRRELDKQLTNMVLNHVIIGFFTVLPYSVMTAIIINSIGKSASFMSILSFIQTITIYLDYLFYAVSLISIILKIHILCFSESILYLHLCIESFSSTIETCSILYLCSSLQTNRTHQQSNCTTNINYKRINYRQNHMIIYVSVNNFY